MLYAVRHTLHSAGKNAELDRYIGYWGPYATNHKALDEDLDIQEEVRNAAQTLREAVLNKCAGHREPGEDIKQPREK